VKINLRKLIPYEEFDYQTLTTALSDYAHPRDKIARLIRNGTIIRVKKGIYIFSEAYRRQPYSKEILANLIYGPSYLSLEFALQYYDMIPERVEILTSVTPGRSRKFFTPAGTFFYQSIALEAYRIGYDQQKIDGQRFFLIAIPEKALADKLFLDRVPIRSEKSLQHYLFEDLRVDHTLIGDLDFGIIDEFALRYRSQKLSFLSKFIKRLK